MTHVVVVAMRRRTANFISIYNRWTFVVFDCHRRFFSDGGMVHVRAEKAQQSLSLSSVFSHIA